MKTLFQFTLIASIFSTLSANASLGIQSIELNNSTIINGTEVSAITLNNNDASVNSIETLNGDLINSSEIRLIRLFKAKKIDNSDGDKLGSKIPGFNLMAVKRGGEDSGG